MNSSSSKSIRTTIDTVQKALSGLKPHLQCADTCAFAVFIVIEKMDSSIFRAWEKYRPSLCKDQAADTRDDRSSGSENIGKHIPTWPELAHFLESEAIIRVHDEKRRH